MIENRYNPYQYIVVCPIMSMISECATYCEAIDELEYFINHCGREPSDITVYGVHGKSIYKMDITLTPIGIDYE